MSETLQSTVVVRYDPDLRSAVTDEPAECAIGYEDDGTGEPVMVVTFGPVLPSGDMLVLALQMRACVAPIDTVLGLRTRGAER